MASEVASHAFVEKFGAVSFSSFTAFEKALNQYMKDNYVVFVRSSSNRSTNAVLRYEWIYYKCSRRPPRPTESRGIRRSYTRSTGCPVRFCLRRQRNHLTVTSYFLEHNHKLSKFLYDRLPINRRLTEDELGTCRALLKYGTPSCEVRQFVADEFGKILTTKDIYNYRQKCRPAMLNDMPSVLAKLRETGRVLVWQSEEGHYSHICFSRWQQIALFRRFPDVVNVDGTHATNRFGYKLYTFLITDGMGTGRPVMYAFVESEQFAPMRKLFDLFKEMMGEQYAVRTFVMDKLAAQMRAARVVFGCDIMLCYFHVRKAIRKHAHSANSRHIFHRMARLDNAVQFRQDLQILRRTDPRFLSYLTARWLYITRKWAVHAQSGMVHFGNVTNNRLENANGRLKDRVHHSDTLEHAIQKVSRHAEWLMREFEMHTSYHCDRRQILEGDSYVLNVVCRMTTYACSLVLRHLGPRPPRLHYDGIGTNKFVVLCDRPTTISDRWCPTDRVSYHVGCCDGEPCPLCGDALQSCPKAPGPSRKRKGEPANRSTKRPSYDVDLDRCTETQHSVSRKSVCVRVFGSKEELLDSQRQLEERDEDDFI